MNNFNGVMPSKWHSKWLLQLPLLLLFALTSWLWVGCDDNPSDPGSDQNQGPVLLVANQSGGAGSLTAVILANRFISPNAAGLGRFPNEIINLRDTLYVVNSGSHDMNVIAMSRDLTFTHVDTMDLGRSQNRSPQFADVTSNGKMFVSNFNDNTVTVVDIRTREVLAYIPVGESPQGVKVVGDKVYVCNSGFDKSTYEYKSGTVTVLSALDNRRIREIAVGINPQHMALDKANRLHIVCTGNFNDVWGEIHIFNTQADTLVSVVDIGGTPGHIAIAENGIAYLAAGGWLGDGSGKVYAYNSLNNIKIRKPDNPIVTNFGAMRLYTGRDNVIYVSCFSAGKVDKIIGEQVVDSYTVGEGPGPLIVIQ